MSTESSSAASRHAASSREAILRSAVALFAEQGYATTTLQEIGLRAGLSRGAPGYLFGSKKKLYAAVIDRVFSQAKEALLRSGEEAEDRGLRGPDAFTYAIQAYIDFLGDHPDFLRLVEWEALGQGARLGEAGPHLEMVMAALESIQDAFSAALPPGYDLTQLMLSIAGMCWFPIAHRETLGRVLQVDPLDPEFKEARKQHVVDLVLHGISGLRRREER